MTDIVSQPFFSARFSQTGGGRGHLLRGWRMEGSPHPPWTAGLDGYTGRMERIVSGLSHASDISTED